MSRKSLYIVMVAALVGVLTGAVLPVAAQDPVTITWFVGLGGGTDAQQIEVQNQVVEDFNASHDDIELVINIAPSYDVGRDTISTLIAAGTPPDIVGPVGVGGSNAFADQWLDLAPLVESTGYDLTAFDPSLLDLYRGENGELFGIPFATFPAITYYNRGLFDEAGLNYPPQEFGAPYVMPDGTEVPWDYNTVAEIAKILTVDANGVDATSADFDPDNIVQFGLNFQFAGMRLIWTDYQPADWYDEATNTLSFPEVWGEAAQWLWDRTWVDHTVPNATYRDSEAFGLGNVFQSGNLGMSITPLWYTCCIGESVGNFEWDIATVPMSADGEYHVAMDADTFRITKGSAHPEEAFEVLTYLLNEAVPVLAPNYGAFPARPEYQQEWIDAKSAQYDWDVNWQVAVDSLAYSNPINEHHESFMPNWQQGNNRVDAFNSLFFGDTGADIDLAAEMETLLSDLQSIAEQDAPTPAAS